MNWAKWISKKLKYGLIIGSVFLIALVWLPWWEASQQIPSSIVVLGGGIRREILAAQLAQSYPNLPIIVSSGSSLPCLYRVFVEENKVDWRRLKVDFRATDTLTNFTALVPYLQSNQTRKVFMVTSKGNLPRAFVLAWLIWGSRGIAMEPVLVGGVGNHESWLKTFADTARAIVWVVLGEKTVANLYNSDVEVKYQTSLRQSECEIGSAILPNNI
ncbi:YdcF family protein [Chlorogloea sp. CCALA 695]|uniref:YdcF family protein n=1 Tax=Chlorogloea sp. CCALA 695 TaxID=2107693 RepID=UPI000D05A36A|nr:YdcF family protein [Chlorogloea sp. CCALA 695]PSB29490.1 hypothetical protein C7B70_18340 [Chlorogloea sp. CCALA 695]